MGWAASSCIEKVIFVLAALEILPVSIVLFYTAVLGFVAIAWVGAPGVTLAVPSLLLILFILVALVLEMLGSGICCNCCNCGIGQRSNLLFIAAGCRLLSVGTISFVIWLLTSDTLASTPMPSPPSPPIYPEGFAPPPSPPWHLMQPPTCPRTWPHYPPNPPQYPQWPSMPPWPPSPPPYSPGYTVISEQLIFLWVVLSLIFARILLSVGLDVSAGLRLRKSSAAPAEASDVAKEPQDV